MYNRRTAQQKGLYLMMVVCFSVLINFFYVFFII